MFMFMPYVSFVDGFPIPMPVSFVGLALLSVVSLAAIDIPMQMIRLTLTDSTSWDYSYGLPVMIGLLFVLLFPKFRNALIAEQ